MTALKAIRQYCLDCSGDSVHEVKLCTHTTCALYAFRFGHSPNRKPMTEEQRQKAADRLRGYRESHGKEPLHMG